MSSDDIEKIFAKSYPDLTFEQLREMIEADKMAGELEELFAADDEVESRGLPDSGKFREHYDAIWWEYILGKIDYQEAIVRIRDYGRLKLVCVKDSKK